jgi:hypothetical protein
LFGTYLFSAFYIKPLSVCVGFVCVLLVIFSLIERRAQEIKKMSRIVWISEIMGKKC